MAVAVEEKRAGDGRKIRKIRVFGGPVTVPAGTTSAHSDDLMEHLAASAGYHSMQVHVTGTGTLTVEQQSSCDGTTYGDAKDRNGTDITTLLAGQTATTSGDCHDVAIMLAYGSKLRLRETGGSGSVTADVHLTIIVRED
ncbi:hypothetical protein OO006_04380 [Prosthecochloris sp. SCSIO W1101]|uniref:hypothetical protein n=1 Tax=Prosthecochloris sp. SCSIO W1101 TaxID=2992242 RepID=UPI00223D71A3|nr:hypothetical protein [Prosthecochloris sp. SCSIO W1101]UZJ42218.1 hypothetical protein OO006_04380 [Prosthecochloris sp. SCSIO W1101]